MCDEPGRFACRCLHRDLITFFFLQKCTRHGRVNRDVIIATVDLVVTDNPESFAVTFLVVNLDPGTEEYLAFLLGRIINNANILQSLTKVSNTAVNFSKQLLLYW